MGRLPVSERGGCNGERRRARTADTVVDLLAGHRPSGLEKYVSPCNRSVSSANSSPAQSVQRGGGSGPAYTVSHRWHPKNRRPSTPQWTGGGAVKTCSGRPSRRTTGPAVHWEVSVISTAPRPVGLPLARTEPSTRYDRGGPRSSLMSAHLIRIAGQHAVAPEDAGHRRGLVVVLPPVL